MKNISFIRNGKEFEPTKDELKRVLDDYAERLALTEKALELAVADKCDFENKYLSMLLGIGDGKVAVPKKEQWYLEKAEEMIDGKS